MKNSINKIIKEEIDDFGWIEETPEYVDVNSVSLGDRIEVVVIDDPNNMFNGKKGTVVRRGDNYEGDNVYITVDWDDFTTNRTLFSTDNVMNSQYRFLKEDFDWATHSPDDIVKELYNKTIIDLNNYTVKLPFVRDKISLSRWDRDPVKRVKSIIELRKNILKYHIEMVYGIESDEVINYIIQEYFKLFL